MATEARCPPRLAPGGIDAYRDVHAGASVIVGGCGPTLRDLIAGEEAITIGVNDVGRLFDPTYLVVVNPRAQFKGDRFRFVEQSNARALFTQVDLGVVKPPVVRFKLGRYGGVEPDGDTLHYTQNSPYVAVCLAAHMGAKRIGLIGVDLTDDHFFARTGRHPLAGRLREIDAQYGRLAESLARRGIELVNLGAASRLTTLRKIRPDDFAKPCSAAAAPLAKPASSLHIVSYSTTPVVGVPEILARCISTHTPHRATCVWATGDYGNGLKYEGGLHWSREPRRAAQALAEADVVIVHNGKVAPQHRAILQRKPVVTMAHNGAWNVDLGSVARGFPGVAVGQFQATLPEFAGWSRVANPVPLEDPAFRAEPKGETVRICFTPSVPHDSYPLGHRLYWHSKGARATTAVLDDLARRHEIAIETPRDRRVSHAESMAMKRRSHIVIDECVTGGYHRNSLEGLAAGCVVVNGVGLVPSIVEAFREVGDRDAGNPFVCSSLDDLHRTLERLVAHGADALIAQGAGNRAWMERHWSYASQWSRQWQPVIDRAREVAANLATRPVVAPRREPAPPAISRARPTTARPDYARLFSADSARYRRAGRESASGPGSSRAETAVLRSRLPSLLAQLEIRTLLDAPCGDFNWMQTVDLGGIEYVGVDVIAEQVARNARTHATARRRFECRDILAGDLPRADAILCRDLLVHLPFDDAHRALAAFRRSGATWLLSTTYTRRDVNVETRDARWRTLNLTLPPFHFPPPLELVDERCTEAGGTLNDKSLGVWRFADLPVTQP
jgi:hypothetical protein